MNDLLVSIIIYAVATVITVAFLAISVFVLKENNNVILSRLRRMGGENWKYPPYSQKTYEIGARMLVFGVMFQVLILNLLLFLALFKERWFDAVMRGGG